MIRMFFLLIIFTYSSLAVNMDLIKGTVTDQNGKPLQTVLYFEQDNGREIRINSDIEGNYSGTIEEGFTYRIRTLGAKINSEISTLIIDKNNQYDEILHNIEVQAFISGLELMQVNLFENNSAKLNKAAKLIIKDIYNNYRNHKKKMKLIITDSDCNNDKILDDRKKAVLQQFFKYNISDNIVEVEIKTNHKLNSGNDSQVIIF